LAKEHPEIEKEIESKREFSVELEDKLDKAIAELKLKFK
jgi:hypothetical protein